MKRTALFLCTASLAGAAWAQNGRANPPATAPALTVTPAVTVSASGLVSLTTAEMPLKDALQSLSEKSGRRILLGPEATGRLTMSLVNVSLERVLSVIAASSGNRSSRIRLPAEKAKTITPEQAQALVSAAEALAITVSPVSDPGRPAVSVAVTPEAPDTETVYLIHTKVDPAAIRAAREEARQAREAQAEAARQQGLAAAMSEDARKDPKVVSAYSALQNLSPDQVAIVAREYMMRSTPEQRQAIGESLSRQRDQIREVVRQQEGHQ